jgi:hypothetical protein
MNPDVREKFEPIAIRKSLVPILIPMPARLDCQPISYFVKSSATEQVEWPSEITWSDKPPKGLKEVSEETPMGALGSK